MASSLRAGTIFHVQARSLPQWLTRRSSSGRWNSCCKSFLRVGCMLMSNASPTCRLFNVTAYRFGGFDTGARGYRCAVGGSAAPVARHRKRWFHRLTPSGGVASGRAGSHQPRQFRHRTPCQPRRCAALGW